MSSASSQCQLLARLAQRGQWRIASSPSPRLPCQQKRISRPQPAQIRSDQASRAFSTSLRLLQEHQTPPHTSAPAASNTSTTTQSTPPSSSSSGPSLPQASQPGGPNPRRRRPRLISAIFLLLLGATTGTAIRAVLAPPPPLLPGTDVDESLTSDIRASAARLPVVQRLMADPEWSNHHDAYEGLPTGSSKAGRLTTGPLGGSRGVGAYQHVWRNDRTGEVVAVIYFGTGTIGWPGVVHGGVIGTILDEHSARAAGRDLSKSGKGMLTANLGITYKKPTLSSDFYVVRANAVPDEALPAEERGKRARKVWVDARIETVQGQVCVEARSLFVAPKAAGLRPVPENF